MNLKMYISQEILARRSSYERIKLIFNVFSYVTFQILIFFPRNASYQLF